MSSVYATRQATGGPIIPSMPDAPATPDRSTCLINDWPVFVHGLHKGQLYPPAENARMVANYAMLSDPAAATLRREDGEPFLTVKVKVGHASQQAFAQRLAKSFGFLNAGKVVKEQLGDNGTVRLWITGLPLIIGKAVNAGYIDAGSIECKPDIPDPRGASNTIPGPVMTAISLLGEEQPAVPGLNSPRAVFADGTPVPAMTPDEYEQVFKVMFEAARDEADATGNAAETMSLAFSSEYEPPTPETAPVTPEQLVAAFNALPPDQQAAVKAQMGQMADGPTPETVPPAQPAAPAPAPKFSDDPAEDKAFAAFAAKFAADCEAKYSAKFSDMEKRFSDLEAAKVADQKKDGEAMSAAFSAEWDAKFAAGDGARKLTPQEAKALKDTDADLSKTAAFSAADARAGILSGLSARLAALPVNPMIQPAGAPAGPIPVQLTGDGRKLLNTIKVTNPRVHDRLTNATA